MYILLIQYTHRETILLQPSLQYTNASRIPFSQMQKDLCRNQQMSIARCEVIYYFQQFYSKLITLCEVKVDNEKKWRQNKTF